MSINAYGYVITNLSGRFECKWLRLCQLNRKLSVPTIEAVKKVQLCKVETIGMMQIYQQQQWVILDCSHVLIMPNIKHPRGC